jgi:hypothetical protein
MLKLERSSDGKRTGICIIGRVCSEHVGEIANEMRTCGDNVFLDLEDVTIVHVEVVRFLAQWEKEGAELLHCPPYIREWISRETQQWRMNAIEEIRE